MKNTVVSFLRALALLLALAGVRPAFAVDSGDILVVSVKGEVHVTMNGAVRAVRSGSVLELPASVRTGRDGGIELRQGRTTVAIGADSLLEFPAPEKRGEPIDRIQQPRGNAFYDIGKREGRKLRVETPYLVGVVKGTQFNIAARDEATTISLFEGLLEVRASDDSAVVDLKAGEIASRRRGEKSISVLKMDAARTPTTGARQQDASSGGETPLPSLPGLSGTRGDRDEASPLIALDPVNGPSAAVGSSVDLRTPVADAGTQGTVDTNLDSGAAAGVVIAADSGALDTAASVAASADNTGVDAGATVAAGVGDVVDAGAAAAVDLAATGASADVTTETRVDAGPVGASVDTSTSVDVTSASAAVDVSAGVQVDAGAVSTSVETSVSVDVGTAGVAADLTTSTDVDTGAVGAAVDTSTSIDVAPDSSAVAVDAGASLAVADTRIEVPVSADAGVDLSAGSVDLGASVAGTDLDLGVDLGLADSEPETDTGSSTTTPATDTGDTGSTDVGGLLDGLLRRPGRR